MVRFHRKELLAKLFLSSRSMLLRFYLTNLKIIPFLRFFFLFVGVTRKKQQVNRKKFFPHPLRPDGFVNFLWFLSSFFYFFTFHVAIRRDCAFKMIVSQIK